MQAGQVPEQAQRPVPEFGQELGPPQFERRHRRLAESNLLQPYGVTSST